MRQHLVIRRSMAWLMAGLGIVALSAGCATKKFVRTQVDTSAQEISTKFGTRMGNDEENMKTTSSQVEELNGVTRDHSQKIGALDEGLKSTDGKAQQAMKTGEAAQGTADKAVTQVSSLDNKFQNRNNYVVLNEEQVRFKLNSAKLDPEFAKTLDTVAQQLKQNPDAILVMEGHTDATGADDYNIQLGQKRLQAVVHYLVVDQEVPMNRISDLSFGEDRPIAPNKTREGRAQNRAVVVRIMAPQLDAKSGMVSQIR